MQTSEKGIALIKEFEGCRLTAYQDSVGVWTIGYGWTQPVDGKPIRAGMTIKQETAERLLKTGLVSYESDVSRLVKVGLTQGQTINDMARWMQYYYAPFLTEKQCIDRVRWCIELFNSAVFFTLKDEFGFENAKTCEKDLKTSFETA